MTQTHHSTASRAVFTSAWTDFCRTNEGRYEYWQRFCDYLFAQPSREIPGELLSLPPFTRPRSDRCRRKPSLARLVARGKQLGVDVTVELDGAVTFRTGSSPSVTVDSHEAELDEWIAKHAH